MQMLNYILYRFKRWRKTPRVFLALILITVFITTPSLFLARLAVKQASRITPWLFPFIMCDRFVLMCVMLAVILVFSDVPICDDTLNYILMRIGRRSWILGEILYVFLTSLMLMSYIWIYSLFINFSNLSFDTEWGAILLSFASPTIDRGVGIAQLTNIYTDPAAACALCLFLSITACTFLGLIILYLSLKYNRVVGISTGSCFAILDFMIYYVLGDYPAAFFLSPVSWVDISCLIGEMYPTVTYAELATLLIIITLVLLCVHNVKGRDELIVS